MLESACRGGGGVCLVGGVPGPGGCMPGRGGLSAWSGGVCVPGPGGGGWSALLGGRGDAWSGGCLVSGIPACTEADTPPCGLTDTCKNITLATTSLRPVIKNGFTELV